MEKYLLIFTFALTFSFLVSNLFTRLKYPPVIGQIIAGILLGTPLVAGILFSGLDYSSALAANDPSAILIDLLAGLGIIFLLLLAGMEIDYKKLKAVGKDAVLIAVSAAVLPFLLGFGLMLALGYSTTIALITGACLSITAEGTKVMVLLELGKLNSRVGNIMIAAGIIDDVFEILFLSVLLLSVSGIGESSLLQAALYEYLPGVAGLAGPVLQLAGFLVELLVFASIVYVLFGLSPFLVSSIKGEKGEINKFMFAVIFGLLIALISSMLGLGTIIGALVAGVIIQSSIQDGEEKKRLVRDIKMVSMGLIVPFFFIAMGLYFEPSALEEHLPLFLLVTAAAIGGKVLGTMAIKPLTDLSLRQLYLIGWGMNSRGAVELVIASIALPIFLSENALEVFSVIISMAIITTLIFPVFLRREINNDPDIMG